MKRNGNLLGLLSGVTWGLDTVILGFVLASSLFLSFGNNASLISTFIHDGFSFIFLMFFIAYRKKFSEFKKVIRSKSGLVIMLAALLGGPIGMGGYILSINYLGPSMSASVSAIYPAVGAILGYLFLKERLKLRSIFGLLLAIAAIILMGYSSVDTVPNVFLGMVFGFVCILGWGSEAVIIGAALKEDVSSEVALAIRQLVSFASYAFIIMPILGYHQLASFDFSSPFFLLIGVAGIVGSISYLMYYEAIALIGPSRAMGLNISYPAWAFFFQSALTQTFDFRTFIFVCIIIVGSVMSAENPRDILDFFIPRKKAEQN